MESPKLSVLFHTNEDKWNSVYHSLFNAPTSRHINIEIKQYQASHGFPAFFYYTEEIVMLLTKMMEEQSKLVAITDALPKIALRHFTKSCLIEEIQSTNDIEGVHSTRKEINTAIDEQPNIKNKKSRHRTRTRYRNIFIKEGGKSCTFTKSRQGYGPIKLI